MDLNELQCNGTSYWRTKTGLYGSWYLEAIKKRPFLCIKWCLSYQREQTLTKDPGFVCPYYIFLCLFANGDKRRAFKSLIIPPSRKKKELIRSQRRLDSESEGISSKSAHHMFMCPSRRKAENLRYLNFFLIISIKKNKSKKTKNKAILWKRNRKSKEKIKTKNHD